MVTACLAGGSGRLLVDQVISASVPKYNLLGAIYTPVAGVVASIERPYPQLPRITLFAIVTLAAAALIRTPS